VAAPARQVVAPQREAGIVERRDRMEQAVAGGARRTQFVPPPRGENGRARNLEGGRELEHGAGKPEKPFHPLDVERLLQRQPFLNRHGAPERDGDDRREGHVSEAAGLDEKRQDGEAEGRKPCRGVDDDEAGETDGGGCGEERVEKGDGATRRGRDGQPEQHGAGENQAEDREGEDPRGVETTDGWRRCHGLSDCTGDGCMLMRLWDRTSPAGISSGPSAWGRWRPPWSPGSASAPRRLRLP